MRSIELDNCPYCKSRDVKLCGGHASTIPIFYYGLCNSCGCSGSIKTNREAAAGAWRQGPPEGDFSRWFIKRDVSELH